MRRFKVQNPAKMSQMTINKLKIIQFIDTLKKMWQKGEKLQNEIK